MFAFLGDASVIDDPGLDGSFLLHQRQHVAAHLSQQIGVAPGRMGDDMVQRLMRLAHVIGGQAGGHRLDALARQLEHQPTAVILQRDVAISVFRGARQALEIGRETFELLFARRPRLA